MITVATYMIITRFRGTHHWVYSVTCFRNVVEFGNIGFFFSYITIVFISDWHNRPTDIICFLLFLYYHYSIIDIRSQSSTFSINYIFETSSFQSIVVLLFVQVISTFVISNGPFLYRFIVFVIVYTTNFIQEPTDYSRDDIFKR